MNTHAIELPCKAAEAWRRNAGLTWSLAGTARAMLVLLGALLPAAGIILVSAWGFGAATPFTAAATLWTAGLVFLALAVDRPGRTALWLALSGITIMVLAALGLDTATEYGVLGGFLLAGWVAAAVGKSLVTRRG